MSRKTKKETLTLPNGTAGLKKVLAHLQLASDELNEAAFFFERLVMDSQRAQIDRALDEAEDVMEVMEVLLGRAELIVDFIPSFKGPTNGAEVARV